MSGQGIFLKIVVILWVSLGISGFLLFYVNKDVKFKKKYYSWYFILIGSLLAIFGITSGEDFVAWLIWVAGIGLITFLNIRNINFCDSCGKTIINRLFFPRESFCSSCGTKLKNKNSRNEI